MENQHDSIENQDCSIENHDFSEPVPNLSHSLDHYIPTPPHISVEFKCNI